MSKIFSHTFNICHGELSLNNQHCGIIHHRYKKLPDDIMHFINEIPGIVDVFYVTPYQVTIVVGECFDAAEIVSSICNRILNKWEAEIVAPVCNRLLDKWEAENGKS